MMKQRAPASAVSLPALSATARVGVGIVIVSIIGWLGSRR